MTDNWIQTYNTDKTKVWDKNGIPWYDTPIPSRLHRCTAQTKALINYFTRVERCACGAVRIAPFHGWLDRNDRRKEKAHAD